MKLWGGRFTAGTDALAAQFNNSITFDWRLVEVDIVGSKAWAEALADAGVLTQAEAGQIGSGLDTVLAEALDGTFVIQPTDEDVHTAVERRLIELIGPDGGKLHTGRSRNDQVATDFRLWMLAALERLDADLRQLQQALINRATQDIDILMPGYTHLQRAQPVLLSHWWLSHFWPLQRDRDRMRELRARTAVMPLGAGALAGTPYPVNREKLAERLGFIQVSQNSLDAVSDRDFAAEFLFDAALLGLHLSRLSEAMILFATAEFGFIELPDAYATGSSLMPQKKNPDTLELTRGKAGTLIGSLAGFLATLKGLPSAYDKDLQEDKRPVFEAADALSLMLPVMAGLLGGLKIKPDRIAEALDPALLATELADYLVGRGVPFRDAHAIVGQVVRAGQERGVAIDRLALEDLRAISPAFDTDVQQVFYPQTAVSRRSATGGTAFDAVRLQLLRAIEKMGQANSNL